MDTDRFEVLLRALTGSPSRRGVARTLAGLGLTAPFGVWLGLAGSEAKKKKGKRKKKKKCKGTTKKCGKKCIPSANCCTAADCDGDETCQNGSCTTTCEPDCGGKECGDDGCGDSCGSCAGTESCEDGTCTPVATCNDGAQNGSESDVDCGGTCPRCANDKACADRNDCASALCDDVFHTCKACTQSQSGGNCGSDADGPCFCDLTEEEQLVCTKNLPETEVIICNDCPAGTNCVDFGGGSISCFKHCGAA